MKKPITAIVLLAGAVSGHSQGQINMNDYSSGLFSIQIFTASTGANIPVTYGGYTVLEVQGNTVNDLNPGATTYSGAPLGTGYEIELLAGAAADSLSQLLPVAGSSITAWTGAGAGGGYWFAPVNLATIPGITTTATVAIAAWNTEGGAITSLAAAQAAGDAWGISDTATTGPLGYAPAFPPFLPASLTSFSLGAPATGVTPEPGTVALVVIGASAFLLRLRRGAGI
jgi:hypothetical protein